MPKFSVASINLNGIRSAMRKDFRSWVNDNQPDVICVQETKAQIHHLKPEEYELDGYYFIHQSAQKPGYSGVGIYSKVPPTDTLKTCGLQWADDEGRFIQCKIQGLLICSLYLPSGTSGDHRQVLKYEMMKHFYQHHLLANKDQPILYCGDWNIAHQPLDIKRDKANENNSGYLPEERQWLSSILELGYVDTFRAIHPTLESFSWWTFRAGARAKNIGWRIDYQIASPVLQTNISDATIVREPQFSDHAILLHTYDL
jgi:exodeoxyribonuclease-3